MKVLIACEESQEVCKAFRALGHEAYSCDLQECSGGHPEWHLQKDATRAMWEGEPYFGMPWDLMIAHPPCTYLSRVGIRWMDRPGRKELRDNAIDFFRSLWCGPVPKVCIENPVPMQYVTDYIGYWDQKIQPYYFGDPAVKTTCLWLKGLPKLNGRPEVAANPKAFKPKPIGYTAKGTPYYFSDRVSKKDQAKIRSKTFPGIARAMAEQWGGNIIQKVA
jgi:hypothetical protein